MKFTTGIKLTAPKVLIYGNAGVGKGQPSDHLLPTPSGPKPIGELVVGDEVFGSDGKPTKVTGVFHRGKLQTYTVTFTDDSFLEVDGDHIWTVEDIGTNNYFGETHWYERNTSYLMSHQGKGRRIPLVKPVDYPAREHKIPPYLMGLYIADGYSSKKNRIVRITKNDPGVIARIYQISPTPYKSCEYSAKYHQWDAASGFGNELEKLGLRDKRSAEKFIPDEYLFDSVENRIDLLHGLMDGDGSIGHREREHKTAHYCSVSEALCEQVAALVTSLGGVARVREIHHHRGDYYKVTLDLPFNPFGYSAEKGIFTPHNTYLHRAIRSIEPERVTDVTCIQVEADDQLYVADTRFHIVTHNSTLASKFSRPVFFDFEGGLNYLDVAKTDHVIRDTAEFYAALMELLAQANHGERQFDTIVIDSADWLVRLITEQVAGVGSNEDGSKSKTMHDLQASLSKNLMDAAGGYGKAKEVLENHIRSMLLPYLGKLNEAGYGIVLIAHQYAVEALGDEGMTLERVMPKIDPPTIGKKPIAMPAIVEWVDTILYLKRNGDDHVVQVEGNDLALAKNRVGLTGEYSLSDTDINELLTPKKEESKPKKGEK